MTWLIVVIMSALTPDDVQPLWVARDEAPVPVVVSAAGLVIRTALIVTTVGAVGGLCLLRQCRVDWREAAFERLAAQIGLDDEGAELIRTLARRAGRAPPVALLISRAAFTRQLARERARHTDPGIRAQLNKLEAAMLA
jgi:hypothetical protein